MDTAPVVVGVDGSDASLAALKWAGAYASKFELPLEAVIAWDFGPYYGYPVPDFDDELRSWAHDAMADAVRTALGEDADVKQRVVRGQSAPVLLEAAQLASLLVVGTRGRGAFAGMLLGSVSQHAVSHAPCPVVVIPHDEEETKGKAAK